jgi:hypothetical protein
MASEARKLSGALALGKQHVAILVLSTSWTSTSTVLSSIPASPHSVDAYLCEVSMYTRKTSEGVQLIGVRAGGTAKAPLHSGGLSTA